jgi:nitroreductase
MNAEGCAVRRLGEVVMDLYEVIGARRSVRAFSPQPVEREKLDRIFAAAAAAPSAMNLQPWHFHVAMGAAREVVGRTMAQSTLHLREYIGILPQEKLDFAERFYADLGQAPLVVAVSAPIMAEDLDKLNTYIGVGCAMENMLLAATAEDLACCSLTFSFWVRDDLATVFALPEDREVVALILVGYPVEKPLAPSHNMDVVTYLD